MRMSMDRRAAAAAKPQIVFNDPGRRDRSESLAEISENYGREVGQYIQEAKSNPEFISLMDQADDLWETYLGLREQLQNSPDGADNSTPEEGYLDYLGQIKDLAVTAWRQVYDSAPKALLYPFPSGILHDRVDKLIHEELPFLDQAPTRHARSNYSSPAYTVYEDTIQEALAKRRQEVN